MRTDPFIDHAKIEQIMREAKVNRARYLQQQSNAAAKAARWGGLSAIVAAALALFTGHGTNVGSGWGG